MVLQARTRGIDDAVREEARKGVKQAVILGAGFDARALRLHAELPGLSFIEVDREASQKVTLPLAS